MTDEEFFDALDGLFAYDKGCVSSGISDEVLRNKVKLELKGAGSVARLTQFARRYMKPPYTIEDVSHFIRWLDDRMGFAL